MLNTFDELIEIASSAKNNRLDESTYRHLLYKQIDIQMKIIDSGKTTLKGKLLKLSFFRFIRRVKARTFYLIKARTFYLNAYSLSTSYSDALIADFQAYRDEYRESYMLLSDSLSQQSFVNLLAGEMLMDLRYGRPFIRFKKDGRNDYCVDLPPSDFEQAFIQTGEVFVDCGAYTGDTLQELIDEGKTPKKYFGFEPDPDSVIKLKKTLAASAVPGIVYNSGVYKSNRVLRFTQDGKSGRVTNDGEISIDVLSLDETIKEPVTLIKMDIEGSEYEALEGGANLIQKYKPKLAICICHKPGDYRKIPLLIKRINPEYSQFFIRYLSAKYDGTTGFGEVVLFVR